MLNLGRRRAGADRAAFAGAGQMADAAQFTLFFRQEFPRVVRTVFLITADHGRAEEVAQDAFMQLLHRWDAVSGYEQPEAWVRRVAIRMAARLARREQMRRVLEGRFRADLTAPPPDEPGDAVHRAVQGLPSRQRAAVVLFYFEDRPIAEIAEILGCTAATARVHLHKARQRLAGVLQEEVDDAV
ncbi:RNA polymerase sigma factor [Dactylosporangium darangshiense]|uniref:RNA polymerase sigma factor n=1 Tax=Dactylosporangium darangshiense TaxID=579108 RepID=UPI0031EB01CC